MIGLVLLLLAGGAKAKAPTRDAGVAAAPAPVDPWEFDRLTAVVEASAQPADEISRLALTQLNVPITGRAQFTVSAHANTVGGVTLTLEDPNDPKSACALYASKDGDGLSFQDSRCAFFVFQAQARAQAVCRKINGTAKRVKDAIHLEATTPDCTAAPLGVPLSVRASVKPVIR